MLRFNQPYTFWTLVSLAQTDLAASRSLLFSCISCPNRGRRRQKSTSLFGDASRAVEEPNTCTPPPRRNSRCDNGWEHQQSWLEVCKHLPVSLTSQIIFKIFLRIFGVRDAPRIVDCTTSGVKFLAEEPEEVNTRLLV